MQKDSKGKCETASHHNLKEKTKNRVDDLQRMFSNLESARKERRTGDVAVFEEQVNQMLREWKVELSEPSPASSLLGGSFGSFSEELARLLQDDATSPLGDLTLPKPKPDPDLEDFAFAQEPQDQSFQGFYEPKGTSLDFHDVMANDSHLSTQLEHHQFDLHQDFNEGHFVGNISNDQYGQDALTEVLPDISPPPAAFLGPKCALWDCSRPAQGSKWCQDYCSSCHAVLALNEGLPGITPVLRPSGLDVKDGPLFSALNLKTNGKEVGIPNCEGAAFTKCPWNAPDLFDLSLLEGEKIREWLFFDKPRRAFESGNRKQRSLPDYNGRGWHESRKQIMKEFGGQKRSYYMDPQPSTLHEWHLYEYDITNYSTCALYRLELKLVDERKSPKVKGDGKKSLKGNVSNDSLADLQKKMGRLTAEAPGDDSNTYRGSADR
ncbi:transcription factor VOZ1 isoform X2 [Morus notabilis]|nr:transcription factor VOZ1 isoform X2 [Morus notabilis]